MAFKKFPKGEHGMYDRISFHSDIRAVLGGDGRLPDPTQALADILQGYNDAESDSWDNPHKPEGYFQEGRSKLYTRAYALTTKSIENSRTAARFRELSGLLKLLLKPSEGDV
jgi:hypothetical protein